MGAAGAGVRRRGGPGTPWDRGELARCLDTLEMLAQTLTLPRCSCAPFEEELADLPGCRHHVRRTVADWPHLEEAAALASGFARATAGNTVVHTDALLAERALNRKVAPGDIDAVLALFCGYFLERRDQPRQHSSPYLRRHQDWCAQAGRAWPARWRGWT